jgi:hypothetical protein
MCKNILCYTFGPMVINIIYMLPNMKQFPSYLLLVRYQIKLSGVVIRSPSRNHALSVVQITVVPQFYHESQK